jgi:hypothetical protein
LKLMEQWQPGHFFLPFLTYVSSTSLVLALSHLEKPLLFLYTLSF